MVRVERIELSSFAWKADILATIRHPRVLGRMTGIEPATSGATTRRSNQMSYIRRTLIDCSITGAGVTRCLGQFLCLRQENLNGSLNLRNPY